MLRYREREVGRVISWRLRYIWRFEGGASGKDRWRRMIWGLSSGWGGSEVA